MRIENSICLIVFNGDKRIHTQNKGVHNFVSSISLKSLFGRNERRPGGNQTDNIFSIFLEIQSTYEMNAYNRLIEILIYQ